MVRQHHDVSRKRHREESRFRLRFGIGEQQGLPARPRNDQRAGAVIVARIRALGRAHHAKIDPVPAPGIAPAAFAVAVQPAAGHRHRARDLEGLPQHVNAAGVVHVVMADNEQVHPPYAARAQVRYERDSGGHAATLPSGTRVEDEHVPCGLDDHGKTLAHVEHGQ